MSRLNRRHFLSASLAAGLTTSLSARTLRAANANDEINLGFISCGGRAGQLMGQFSKVEGDQHRWACVTSTRSDWDWRRSVFQRPKAGRTCVS